MTRRSQHEVEYVDAGWDMIQPWKRARDARVRAVRFAKPPAKASTSGSQARVPTSGVSPALTTPTTGISPHPIPMVAPSKAASDVASTQYEPPEEDIDEQSQGYVSFGDTDSLGSLGTLGVVEEPRSPEHVVSPSHSL